MERFIKWDYRFLELAKTIAQWSKDPSTQVGAVIVDDINRIAGVGYNGFPRYVNDDPEKYENRETKLRRIVHAEANAILNRASLPSHYDTIYTYPLMPCPHCAGLIIQAGIQRVVSLRTMPERWKKDMEESIQLFKEAHVSIDLYDNNCV